MYNKLHFAYDATVVSVPKICRLPAIFLNSINKYAYFSLKTFKMKKKIKKTIQKFSKSNKCLISLNSLNIFEQFGRGIIMGKERNKCLVIIWILRKLDINSCPNQDYDLVGHKLIQVTEANKITSSKRVVVNNNNEHKNNNFKLELANNKIEIKICSSQTVREKR
ncbi:hypothetical protein BpHYR1_041112 [Brachionus plicatilis]|uniref:Uncharacterized protein n=1 Tax=Brachionus plicatilis TaxID=10195 RepID=A0A3M7S3J2_BRAPC|nr:hypothetical protein BpHYR1_041112 [Brachionus plicatilis]